MNKFIILLALMSFNGFSQGYVNYHNLCNQGAEYLEFGKYAESKNVLLSAIHSVDEPLAIDYFNLAKCYSQLNKLDSTLFYLELSLKLSRRTKDLAKNHNLWFEPILGSERWNRVLDTEYYTPTKLKRWQKRLGVKIENLVLIDQYHRVILDSIVAYFPNDTALIDTYKDSITMDEVYTGMELEKIMKRRGWPGEKVNGYRTTDDCLLLLHLSEAWYNRMEEILIKEIDKGNLAPWCFADISDAIRYERDLPLKYNGFFGYTHEITPEIRENCSTIGAPLGKVRTLRVFYRM